MMQMNESEVLLQEEDLNSLEHYGIKGQKWGLRRYQNPDGSYTELGKERRRVGFKEESKDKDEKSKTNKDNTPDIKVGGKAYKDMTKKELRAARKRARHNEAERRAKREFNRDKREAIENGDIAFISKNISKFTNDEIDESITRYKKMQDVWKLDKDSQKNADHYLDKAIHYLQKVDKLSTSLTNIYNSFTESGNKSEAKRNQKNVADQNYWKALQEKYKYEHPNSEANKNNNNNDNNKNSGKSEKEKYKEMKDADRKKEREEEAAYEREERDEKYRRKEEKRREKEERKQEKEDRKYEKWKERQAEKEEREQEKWKEKMEREREKEEEKWEKRREKEEARREREREEAEEKRRYYEDFADDLFRRTEAKRRERESEDGESKYLMLPKFGSVKMDKNKYNELVGSFFSKKDKDKNKDYMNSDSWKKTSQSLDDLTSKYLSNLSNSNNKNSSSSDSFRFKIGSTRDDKWKKTLSKKGADTNIEKWEKELIKKYKKERNMDTATAEKYAERYIDYWLDAYDEGKV